MEEVPFDQQKERPEQDEKDPGADVLEVVADEHGDAEQDEDDRPEAADNVSERPPVHLGEEEQGPHNDEQKPPEDAALVLVVAHGSLRSDLGYHRRAGGRKRARGRSELADVHAAA